MMNKWSPISIQQLRLLSSRLESSRHIRETLAKAVRILLDQPTYSNWFGDARLAGLPYCGEIPDNLLSLGLADEQEGLLLQIHRLGNSVFFTDPPAADKADRVYPYPDESERIHECAWAHALYDWGQTIIDPACGCGHHALAWPGSVRRIMLDKSPRALAYARLNALFNNIGDATIAENDIRQGIPASVQSTEQTVFLVNAPFSLSPIWGVLPSTSDGGHTGASLTVAALEGIRTYWHTCSTPVRAVVLCYTVGKSPSGPWEVVDRARQLFVNGNLEFNLLTNEMMVRIDGRKRYPVPVTTRQFADRANCHLDVLDSERQRFREGYQRLIEALDRDGWAYVGYGTLYLELPARS